jgi:subtilisin family serine protease
MKSSIFLFCIALALNTFSQDLSDIGLNNPEPFVGLEERIDNRDKIKVAVIDSGVDYNHPYLSEHISYDLNYPLGFDINEQDKLPYDNHYGYKPQFQETKPVEGGWGNLRSIGNSLLNNSLEVLKSLMLMGSPGHGTHVSGIVIDNCQNTCSIFPVKVFGKNELKPQFLIDAIEAADQAGVKVINMSLGIFEEHVPNKHDFENLKKVILEKSHIIFVVAAGNDGQDLGGRTKGRVFPAMINAEHIITVGSHDQHGDMSKFSNFSNDYVDTFALGEDVLSTWPEGETKALSGTSMASPKVAGEISSLWNNHRNKSASEIVQLFLSQ